MDICATLEDLKFLLGSAIQLQQCGLANFLCDPTDSRCTHRYRTFPLLSHAMMMPSHTMLVAVVQLRH